MGNGRILAEFPRKLPMSNRHTVLRFSFGAMLAIVGLSISMLSYAQDASSVSSSSVPSSSVAASSTAASATQATVQSITVEQQIDGQTDFTKMGSWVITKPDFTEQGGNNTSSGINNVTIGSYTLFADAPDGMTTTTYLYRNGVEEKVTARPQITFRVEQGQSVRVLFVYKLTQVGKVGVNSTPPGVSFTLKGPNESVFTGITPTDYDIAPNGQYSVTYDPPPGCPKLPSKSMKLETKGRIVFTIELECADEEALKATAQSASAKSSNSSARSSRASTALTGSITTVESAGSASSQEIFQPKPPTPTASVTATAPTSLIDVPPNSWFAPYVFKVTQRGIMKGYNDENGNPNGMFGPTNLVTVAELSAIAHRLGSINEQEYAHVMTSNTGALNKWFTPYFTSAEQRGWAVYQDPFVEIDRPVSRAEVVQTFLQVLDMPLAWPKGKIFTDVSPRLKYAAAIETAASKGFVEGRKDANGNSLGLFVPFDPINRAELSKVIDIIMTSRGQ